MRFDSGSACFAAVFWTIFADLRTLLSRMRQSKAAPVGLRLRRPEANDCLFFAEGST